MKKIGKSILEINLSRIQKNYLVTTKKLKKGVTTAVVVKANAYGLGMKEVSKTLYEGGCRDFCVAYVEEAFALRKVCDDASIIIFNGLQHNEIEIVSSNKFIPVLNDLYQIELWNKWGKKSGQKLPGIIHVDTGMGRLGLTESNFERIAHDPKYTEYIDIKYLMSHLSCADTPLSLDNERQLKLMMKYSHMMPNVKVTFANSAGVYLGYDYQFDHVRPGCAIYGVNPIPSWPTPVQQVATLMGEVVQIRTIEHDQTISYQGRYRAHKGDKIATVLCGYADGYHRALSNNSFAFYDGMRLPVVGNVTMDMIMLDVSSVPETKLEHMNYVELLGDNITVDELAFRARTIGYEVLTSLGNRFERIYK
jgi:alanine racemase